MAERRRYRKKSGQTVIAVKLDLETDGLTYRKWGAEQKAKAGDWIVLNAGDTYTVDNDTFQATYRQVSPGNYVKSTPIWAEVASADGSVSTLEGESHYKAGDYVVCNKEDGTDTYCIAADVFEAAYELDAI